MDLRSQTSLLASVLIFAITATVVLRSRKRRVHWYFSLFSGAVGAWYLTTFLARFLHDSALFPFLERLNLVCAVFLPLSAVQSFRAFLGRESRRTNQLGRLALLLAGVLTATLFTPLHGQPILATLIFIYVIILLGTSLGMLYLGASRARSPFDRARLRYLAVVGTLASLFTLADYLPYVGLDIPPVGAVLMLVFLYQLSQSILQFRILDLYELAGRLLVLTVLSFALAGILWVLVQLDPGHFFLHSVVAALGLFLLFEPARAKVEAQIAQFFFRERHLFERSITELRQRLAHVLSVEEMVELLMATLESSRRVTHAALYLVDEDGLGYALARHVGPQPVQRLEIASAQPLLEKLWVEDSIVLENVEREIEERRELGEEIEAESLREVVQILESMLASVCIPLRSEEETYGLLVVRDERLRDAFVPEDVLLLRGLAAQAAIAVKNSRVYQRLKRRDRLAALGEMSAGLAHEIRNPLGAIKASAQLLQDPEDPDGGSEFVDIIVEEVDRLNRVVSSFLDYARPTTGADPEPVSVNAIARRTLEVLGPDLGDGIESELELAEDLPRVHIDAEQLRQVLINLCRNAAQAMEGRGELRIRTLLRVRHGAGASGRPPAEHGEPWVELRVSDTGPGIPQRILQNLFVPFVTTKARGTGLGLAISQRIINAAGGDIDARSHAGVGTTLVVRLPAMKESKRSAPNINAVIVSIDDVSSEIVNSSE